MDRAGFEPWRHVRYRWKSPLSIPWFEVISGAAIPTAAQIRRGVDCGEWRARGAPRFSTSAGKKDAERSLPVLNHQIEFVDETVDFLEIFAAAFFRFDIEGATEGDHIAQVANGILGKLG
jgi:hypothetical protein